MAASEEHKTAISKQLQHIHVQQAQTESLQYSHALKEQQSNDTGKT